MKRLWQRWLALQEWWFALPATTRLVVFILQFLVGCAVFLLLQQTSPKLTPTEEFFLAAKIKAEDLPRGWRQDLRVRVEQEPGAEGRFFTFSGPNDPNLAWESVSEELLVFGNADAAQAAYSVEVKEVFPPAYRDKWKHIPELDFPHHADEMEVACIPGYINNLYHQACVSVARYQHVVVIVRGLVFEDRWLRMPDFRAVLVAADRRMIAALKQ